MAVYLTDDKVLLDSGSVATSKDCCCGEIPHCPCVFTNMFGPCCDGDPDFWTHCTDQLLDDTGCPSPTTPPFCIGSSVDYFTTRFSTVTVVCSACGGDLTGTSTYVFGTDPDTCEVSIISCTGSIRDGGGVCIQGGDVDCPGCFDTPQELNIQCLTTYSDPCGYDTGACFVGLDCSQQTPITCDFLGGVFLGENTTCP